MTRLKAFMVALLLAAWVPYANAEEPPTLADVVGAPALGEPMDPEVARVEGARIGKGLRCPVCQGLSVSDSPSEAARAALQRIQDLLIAGYTEEQVEDYFVDRYGEWALLAPRADGLNWIVWLGPVVGVLFGLWAIRRRLLPSGEAQHAAPPSTTTDEDEATPSDRYAQEVLATLQERKQ